MAPKPLSHWRERIMNFTPSWFTICMGSGVASQILVNFPYPITGGPRWMRNLGYCFWILDIVLFGFFTLMLIFRYIRYPKLFKKTLTEFPTSSFLGAIPITLGTIIIGIISFYNYRNSARWAAFGLWWVEIVLTCLVSIGVFIVQISQTPEHSISEVTGAWIMVSVPMIVCASAGATILPYMLLTSPKVAIIILVISFMMWSFGLIQVHIIFAIYTWRLISCKLPPDAQLAGGFLPLAALGQAAYAIQQMSIFLSNYLISQRYAPTQSLPPPVSLAVLQSTGSAIHWLGILLSLFLLAEATFWWVQALSALASRRPKTFNVTFWSLTFPWGSYANAWSYLSRDLRNDGMRGWAAAHTVIVLLVWLVLALLTIYLGAVKGDIVEAPGLDEWIPEKKKEDEEKDAGRDPRNGDANGRSSSREQQNGIDGRS